MMYRTPFLEQKDDNVGPQRLQMQEEIRQMLERREAAVTAREQAVLAQEDALYAKAELAAQAGALLREANERLVVATVHAQIMTETAEGATAQMSYMAKHDILTGLPNRSLLTDRLEQSIALALRHEQKVALVYLDLDNFKHINDSLGHAVGDQLLQAVAQRMQDSVRQSDSVCRLGGDEFVLLLAEIHTVEDAARTAAMLIEAASEPYQVGPHRLHVSASIGVSIYPDDGGDVETLVRNADTAMYQAKKNGRNNYQVFSSDMTVRAVARQTLEVVLHQALDHGGFVLHYQPKVNLETGAIIGAEALLRLQRPGQALIYPGHFVGVAEECGLIVPMGKWMLREACNQAVAWLRAGLPFGQMAVNVSAVEFHGKGFLSGVQAVLEETGLDPCALELELTESGLMQDNEPTITILRALKDMGVRIAIDDFGTGYSSLSYLRRFPIDTLKIDQSFVRDIPSGNGEAKLVSAIIAMGRSLDLRVIAEGIETREQLVFLQSQNCAEGQGYYFSRPLVADLYAVAMHTPLGVKGVTSQ
ncbi:diguanylate cyclase (GGDEF) domain-containing protein [Rhodoferax sp. OV413]|uniref:putative bifunctional diguanylate cyclase/phosphodiesterase n=1 Tax=Rhodoferax sp. OV413 TaxID=1855285 RepID=UPI00088F6492|nr:EAL domain-containing protein [Rhodoferax sp. OV413]SDP88079.1 diguanylate cyclase (GGDEF) domain-containing protein [Rhodoferax sp. OV413]